MPDLGLEVLLKGKNLTRLFMGLGAALKISLAAVLISIPLGILLGALMTWKNPIVRAMLRIYLEVIRNHESIWMGSVRRKRVDDCVFPVGNCGDERPGAQRFDQHSRSSV